MEKQLSTTDAKTRETADEHFYTVIGGEVIRFTVNQRSGLEKPLRAALMQADIDFDVAVAIHGPLPISRQESEEILH